MITISTYQLRDYPCIYYLSKLADDEVQYKFLCGLGSIFNMDAAAISASSILFAHISKGLLYGSTGIKVEQIETLQKSDPKLTYRDCKSLTKSNLVRKYNLPSNCCMICPLSHTYVNDRIDIERRCLRYTIDTGKLVTLQSKDFYSIISLAPGNDISNYPLIPFNKYLNDFFKDNDPHGPYDISDLTSTFSKYLFSKLGLSDNLFDGIRVCVERELGQLYNKAYADINESEVSSLLTSLLSPYKYNPPRFHRPDEVISAPKAKKPSPIVYEEIPDLESLMEHSNIKEEIEKASVDLIEAASEELPLNVECDIVNIPDDSDIECESIETFAEEPRLDFELLRKIVSMETGEKEKSIDEQINHDLASFHCMDTVPSVLYPTYSLASTLENEIIKCTMDDAKTVLQFINNTCASNIMCVECVVFNSKHGLLFMTTSPIRFYFFDIKSSSSGFLYPALSDAYKIKFLSLNPLPVISMLSELGFNEISIESLTGLYSIINGVSVVNDYREVFFDELSICNDDSVDFYQFYMPFYKDLYNVLWNKLNSENNTKLMAYYKNGLKLNNVFGHNYDLSEILFNHKRSIAGTGFTDYRLELTDNIPIIKEGIMYKVSIPRFINEEPEIAIKFFEDVCIGVFFSPLKCIRSSKLISFTSTYIVYFATADGDMFFDILLDTIRRKYKSRYKDIPTLQTYRTEYR